ncbi:hypothetical protein Tco_0300567 [Tanacetum coccineum]
MWYQSLGALDLGSQVEFHREIHDLNFRGSSCKNLFVLSSSNRGRLLGFTDLMRQKNKRMKQEGLIQHYGILEDLKSNSKKKIEFSVFGFIEDVITKTIDYHLFDVVVEFHRFDETKEQKNETRRTNSALWDSIRLELCIFILSVKHILDGLKRSPHTPTSPDYFPVSPGNISPDPSDNLSKYLLASLAISSFHDDPYMQAYNDAANEPPIPPQAPIDLPPIFPPSPVLPLSPMFDS